MNKNEIRTFPFIATYTPGLQNDIPPCEAKKY